MPDDQQLPLRGRTAVVLGTGGAARALAFGAATLGARVVVAGRRLDKAQELADVVLDACCFSGDSIGVSIEDVQAGLLPEMDIVLNTTPLGMVGKNEDKSPLSKEILEKVWCRVAVGMCVDLCGYMLAPDFADVSVQCSTSHSLLTPCTHQCTHSCSKMRKAAAARL